MKLKQGLIQVYTGNGKGKTTAAIGLGIRALGRGLKVYMVQFLKTSDTGELHVIKNLDGFDIFRFERPRGFFWTLSDSDKIELQKDIDKAMEFVKETIKNNSCDLLILDEVMGAIGNGLIDKNELISLLKSKHESMEIVLTGRNVPQEIAEIANYISEINPVKHSFDEGIPARKGIEF
ncbi:putative cob(I)yrinic acid a c-diamide adenosyltransferase [Gottschalkia purinilytica]|uniref:Putative cob(I)yrinic acid a c-diamide adenosyltransferase n=1 Tax=Gottschalkia purinilytica TaxID=1503 RepID=A0A0L0W6F9_GOTPU|nr:cob(I)yrinic acid a,c-diamide adenosyltransferase [Gottschalkia purinilytica]KNF07071.1 putative cob(I)yrinic acid a c-diamide adenosyltransferase [Gottschalkia purinilytica]